ncbi:MAG: hypothetical protein PVI71_13775, partial [Desulfobacterales bacterium]
RTATLTDKREDFELNFLDRYLVGQDLLRSVLEGKDPDAYRPLQIAKGLLPHAKVGTFHYKELSVDVAHFVSKIKYLKDNKVVDQLEARIDINNFNLQVRLPEIYERGLIHVRYARQRAQDILRSWIYHLAFCEMKPQDRPPISILIFKNAAWQLNPVDDHRQFLANLLNLFKQGLEKPLHFFPNASLEYVRQEQINGKSKTAALKAAQRKWANTDFSRGESDDPYYDICFRMVDPLDRSFQNISETVFKPILAYCSELEI